MREGSNRSDFYFCFVVFFSCVFVYTSVQAKSVNIYVYIYIGTNSVTDAFKENTFLWNIDVYIFKIKFYVDLQIILLPEALY